MALKSLTLIPIRSFSSTANSSKSSWSMAMEVCKGCFRVSSSHQSCGFYRAFSKRTSIGHYLLCVACKGHTAVFGTNFKLLRASSEIFGKCPQHVRSDVPSVLGRIAVEQCLHYFNGLISELVSLDDTLQRKPFSGSCQKREVGALTMAAYHFDDKAAFCLVNLVLNEDFASFHGRIGIALVLEATPKHGKKRLADRRVSFGP